MKKKLLILILFLLILVSGIGIVSAEIVTGSFDSAAGWTSKNYNSTSTFSYGFNQPHYVTIYYTELTSNSKSLVHFDGPASYASFDAGAPQSAYTSFYGTIGGVNRTTGTIGYQRNYNTSFPTPGEIAGYQYIIFDTWNITGLSGTQSLTLVYNKSAVYNFTYSAAASSVTPPTGGYMDWGAVYTGYGYHPYVGSWTYNYDVPFHNTYNASSPSGLGIEGTVDKNIDGISYPSRAYVINPITGSIITSNGVVIGTDFFFNVLTQPIQISVKDSNGVWYNSSTLFAATSTPTPTPTTTAEPTPALGYVRTYAHVKDRGGNLIHGANINIKDTFGNTWRNSSSDADGISYIDTLPNAYINIYADFTVFENEFLPGSLLTQAVGPGGNTYYLVLYPYESGASEGNVSLYVEVKDADGSFIPYANVQIILSNGYSYAGSTANQGSKVFLVPNNTIVRATGTAPGYLPATVIGNSGAGGSMTMTINLQRQTVTSRPTSTIPPGGVTPAVTVDPNDPALHGGDTSYQGQEMMRYLANHGMDLVQLCFMVTILALLGFKFGR